MIEPKSHAVEALTLELGSQSQRIIHLCEEIAEVLSRVEIRLKPTSEKSLLQLSTLEEPVLSGIEAGLGFYRDVIQSISRTPDLSTALEIELLEKAFGKLGVRPKSSRWRTLIQSGQLIEIYNLEMVQVYRNFEFFKQCSYDLLTLVTFPWNSLYLRPSSVTKALYARAQQILESTQETTHYHLPPHVLKENLPNSRKVFLVEMKTLTPLLDDQGETRLFLHFVSSEAIAEGSVAADTHLI